MGLGTSLRFYYRGRDKRHVDNNWTWLRMQVVRRDHYRCRECGKPGDEITLEVCQKRLSDGERETLSLCATCHRAVSLCQ